MVTEGFVPSDYVDEVTPPPRPSPSDWITSLDDGMPALAACDPEGDDDNALSHPVKLTDGQIVEFYQLIDHGNATLRIDIDGQHHLDRPMPAGATHVRADGDNDTVTESIKHPAHPEMEAEYDLDYYEWRDRLSYRFDAAARRFVPVEKPANDA